MSNTNFDEQSYRRTMNMTATGRRVLAIRDAQQVTEARAWAERMATIRYGADPASAARSSALSFADRENARQRPKA